MKLKQFLQPADSYFSTPKAARRLLRLFAQFLVLGTIAGALVSILSIFSSEISRRQGYLNDAIVNARVFFTQREALLKLLVLSSVNDLDEGRANAGAQKDWYVDIGHPGKGWSLHLTDAMTEFMKDKRLNLVYVPEEPNTPGIYLSKAVTFLTSISQDTLRRLRTLDAPSAGAAHCIWLSDQGSSSPRLYLFTRAAPDRPNAGWIGMEMDASDVSSSLHDDSAGQFLMLNPHGDVMMSSTGYGRNAPPVLKVEMGHVFGLSGEGVVPNQLVMQRQLGYSDWKIFYTIDLLSLLSVFCWPLTISFFLISITAFLVYRLVSRIERRLITPATQRIDALIESEAFSRAVIQTAPVALCVLRRADGQVVLENRLSEQWLGECNERERLCHRWIEQAFDNNETNQSDEFQAGNGRHLYLSFVRTRYNAEDVLFCAFSDISSRKQVEAALAMAKQMADAANEAKTLFLATMSHEIRTPLYGVLGTLELLAKTELRPQQKAYLHAIENSSSTLLNLVCDVLDVSKIEAGQLALNIQDFSPLELVHNVIQSYVAAARSKGLSIYSFIDPVIPGMLRGDLTRIRQILNNLLNNAVKFTESGQIVLRVKVGALEGGRIKTLWQVSDSGPGIALEDQAYLFDPFYQTGNSTNVIAGTGLGLSICQRLAELMNGNIRVVSAPGLGSSFTLEAALEALAPAAEMPARSKLSPEVVYVYSPALEMSEYIASWLRHWGARTQIGYPPGNHCGEKGVLIEIYPYETSHVCPEWDGPRIVITSQELAEERQSPRLRNIQPNDLNALFDAVLQFQGDLNASQTLIESEPSRKLDLNILVAEDNVINQLILKDQLEALGCRVIVAQNGSEALMLWNGDDFDVVLTDINMPGMNGYDLARELRRIGCRAPIVGATANAMRDETDRCLSAGMQQLLVKPFGLGALYNCMQQYEGMNIDGL
ncbi:ATP-binding protein [Pseudomonas sp. NPDC089569]|uniref:ATP-binding protein n=1 Tax=Pseudomonas sp. NPDC089569 TaxID=3390722 RepID=UPI003CFD3EC0